MSSGQMPSDYDIVIVGAGIAGSSAAITLAPRGYRILLLDEAVFPRHKCCGEGVMPQGVAILEELGLLPETLSRGGARFRGIRLRSLEGVAAEADFPPDEGNPCLGVAMRRFELDHLLLQRAKTFPNVTVREGFRVAGVLLAGQTVEGVEGYPANGVGRREVFRSPLIIAADGRSSVFHTGCGISKVYLPRKRFGVTGHLSGLEGVGAYVEVLMQPHGEIYLAPCREGLSLVALLLEKEAVRSFRGDLTSAYSSFLKSAPGFGKRMRKAELIPPVLMAGPLGFAVEPCYGSGLLLVGDSAGFLDPITGEGMALTLKSVRAAVPVIDEAFAAGNFGAGFLQRYAEERSRLVEDLFRFTRLVLTVSKHKPVVNRAIRRLSRDRALFRKLLGVVTGANRYSEINLWDKCSLLLG
ncbi:MAG: FAD-dependent oxidoreductase [Thermoanaerobaculia bacterium]